jgi:hypothetical protein
MSQCSIDERIPSEQLRTGQRYEVHNCIDVRRAAKHSSNVTDMCKQSVDCIGKVRRNVEFFLESSPFFTALALRR